MTDAFDHVPSDVCTVFTRSFLGEQTSQDCCSASELGELALSCDSDKSVPSPKKLLSSEVGNYKKNLFPMKLKKSFK